MSHTHSIPLAVFLALASTTSSAILTQRDSTIFGSATITRDSEQSLDWLTPNATIGMSFSELLTALATDNRFAGFRVATLTELDLLYSAAGIPDVNVAGFGALLGTTANFSGAQLLQALTGTTYSTMEGGRRLTETAGFVGNTFISPVNGFLSTYIGNTVLHPNTPTDSGPANFASAYTTWASAPVGTQYQGVGTWLVSSVPEPTKLILLLAGLSLVVCAGRRGGASLKKLLDTPSD
jgi:hypothetical protein